MMGERQLQNNGLSTRFLFPIREATCQAIVKSNLSLISVDLSSYCSF